MKSNVYWENRTNQILADAHENNTAYLKRIGVAHDKALADVQTDINKIFAKYANGHNLSTTEAKKILNSTISNTEVHKLRHKLSQISNEELKKSILAELNANAYRARITRLEALKQSIQVNYATLAEAELKLSTSAYIDTIKASYYRNIYEIQKGINLSFDVSSLNTRAIDMILETPWVGRNYSTSVWKNTDTLASKLTETITSGFISGKSLSKVAKELEELTDYGKFAAERLVRTETTFFNSQAALKGYEEVGIEKYMFVATLDLKTSNVCREHDRKTYKISEARAGENLPPLHAFCRSTTRSYLGEEFMASVQRRARDPETGKTYLVGNMSYAEWHKKYVKGNTGAELTEQKLNNKYTDKKQHEEYKKILGKDAPKSFDKFQELKYTDVKEWGYIKDYCKARANGDISAFSSFKDYKKYSNQLNEKVIGITTVDGIEIKSNSKHMIDRILGTDLDRKTGRARSGVEIDGILDALKNPVDITVEKKRILNETAESSKKYIGEKVTVSINPDTGNLIQCNPSDADTIRRLKNKNGKSN